MTKFSFAMLGTLLFLLPSAMIGQDAAKKLSAEDFLSRVRNPPGRDSWAKMKGSAQHLREGSRPIQAPIEMGIFFTPVRTMAQIRFNGNEIYNIGQSYGRDASTSVEKQIPPGVAPQIGVYGITPEDLAMSFLYWKFKEELKMESLRGQDCRVFLLESKDGREQVRVAVNCEYFFPMRAEWFRMPDKTPVRTLVASAFKKSNDYWFVSKILLSGKDWSTSIRFPEVDAGAFKGQLPPGVFRQ